MSFPSDQGRNENRPMMFDGWGYVPLTIDPHPLPNQRNAGRTGKPGSPVRTTRQSTVP